MTVPLLGPLVEPLFLLHTGALFGNERDEWEVQANSSKAVDELAEAQPLGATLQLYALTPEDVAAVNAARKARAEKVLEMEKYGDARAAEAAAAERDACAKVADEYATWGGSNFDAWFLRLAVAIRARGEA